MITKNSADRISKPLESYVRFIGYYVVVVDDSTTDQTVKVIKRFFKQRQIKGEIVREKWVNFSHNRNIALRLCDSDRNPCPYVFFVDDNDVLKGDLPLMEIMTHQRDTYLITSQLNSSFYFSANLVHKKAHLKGVFFLGRVHEYLNHLAGSWAQVQNCILVRKGGRCTPEKLQRYLAYLLEDLADGYDLNRTHFYLGNTLFDLGRHKEAREYYQKRVEGKGWDEEVFMSLYKIGCCAQELKEERGKIIDAYLTAYQYRPTRYEPLARISLLYAAKAEWHCAYHFANWGLQIGHSKGESLFVDKSDFYYYLLDSLGLSALNIGKYDEAIRAITQCLSHPYIPLDQRPRLLMYLQRLREMITEGLSKPLEAKEAAPWLERPMTESKVIQKRVIVDTREISTFRSCLRHLKLQGPITFSASIETLPGDFKTTLEGRILHRFSLGAESKDNCFLVIPKGKLISQELDIDFLLDFMSRANCRTLCLSPPAEQLVKQEPLFEAWEDQSVPYYLLEKLPDTKDQAVIFNNQKEGKILQLAFGLVI